MRNGAVEFHHNTRFGVHADTAFIGRVVNHQRVVVNALVRANRTPAVRDVFQVHRTEWNKFCSGLLADGEFHKVGRAQSGGRHYFRLLGIGRTEKMRVGPVEMVCPVIIVTEGGFKDKKFTVGQIYIKRLPFVAALHHARGFHFARAVLLDEHHVIAYNSVIGLVVRPVVYAESGFEAAHAFVQFHYNLARSVNAQTGIKRIAGNGQRTTAHTLIELNRHIVVAVGGIFEVDCAECNHLFGGATGGKREMVGQRRRGGQRHREETRE